MDGNVTAKAVLTKAELSSLIPFRGHLNRGPVTIGGATYASCTLKFKGFIGKYVATNKIDGEYTFIPAQPSDAENDLCEFLEFPGLGPSACPTAVPAMPPESSPNESDEESEVEDDGDQ